MPLASGHYQAALRALQLGAADPLQHVRWATRFVPAQVLRASVLIYSRDLREYREGRAPLARLEALALDDNPRRHLAALRHGMEGDFRAARAAYDAILSSEPGDFVALWCSQIIDYYLGEPQALRERTARVLQALAPSTPGYHAVLAMHAFGLEECGEYEAAEATARRALELEPGDQRALHALVHVFEMQGRPKAGLRAIAAHARRATLSNHLWWHAALFHLQEGRPDAALRVYERCMRLGGLAELIDASSLLWRLQLAGVEVGDWFAGVADRWEPYAEDGFCSFNDLHAMMAFVAVRRWASAERLLAAMERRLTRTSGANYEMTRLVGLPASRALLAFGQGQFARAETLLRALPPVAHRLGGSHAQRDVLQLTRAAAAAGARRARFLLAA
ncbi:MAG TPA: tetratricopeptide repeat protein [Burkholderiales bacterium]|nr:tetratricopeptide repeat protein [Burkholderiales bacterium]